MRWDAQVCLQCGGELHVDYSEAVLVCSRCGSRERLPRIPRSTTRAGTVDRDAAGRGGLRRAVGLVAVGSNSQRLIEEVCAERGYKVATVAAGGSPAGRLPRRPHIDLLVVEADRSGQCVNMAREIRHRYPAASVAVVLTSWCEAEREAGSTAEFILHAPLRRAEVVRMLQVMEDYGGWLPGPVLASKYRARLAG